MLDNFELISNLLNFESEDDFYFMQLIQRRKENPEMKTNSRALKNYIIQSKDYLMDRKDEIVMFAKHYNARATIRLNRRSFKQCAFQTLRTLADELANDRYPAVDKLYAQVMGSYHADPVKKWLLDCDDILPDSSIVQDIRNFIQPIQPIGDKVVAVIPSRTGCHIITTPFDPRTFNKEYPKIEIIKDSPTNIYIP